MTFAYRRHHRTEFGEGSFTDTRGILLRQTHVCQVDVDPSFGPTPAACYHPYLTAQRERHGLTAEAIRDWADSSGNASS
jgi:hypothetical protein